MRGVFAHHRPDLAAGATLRFTTSWPAIGFASSQIEERAVSGSTTPKPCTRSFCAPQGEFRFVEVRCVEFPELSRNQF